MVRAEIVSLLNHFLADHALDENAPKPAPVAKTVDDHKNIKIEDAVESVDFIIDAPDFEEETLNEVGEAVEEVVEFDEPIVTTNKKASYKADILLAKKSAFETKLFVKLLDSLGYTYETASSSEELTGMIEANSYKVIMFDKECEELNLEHFSSLVKESNIGRDLDTYLILINDASSPDNSDDALYVHEIIKFTMNY